MSYDNRRALPKGHKLIIIDDINNDSYSVTIAKEIGRGGSCIVYSGMHSDLAGSQSVVVKEVYPKEYDDKLSREENMDIVIPESIANKFEERINIFREGQKKHRQFYDCNSNKILPSALVAGKSHNTFYTVSSRTEGTTLSNIQRDKLTLVDILGLIASVCDAISLVHKHLMLYLDCKPDNLYYFENENKAYLFDFDTVQGREKIDFCSCSDGWAAPEQAITDTGYKDKKKIGYHTDIFSIGAVFFYLLIGRKPSIEDINNIQTGIEWMDDISLPNIKNELRYEKVVQELDRTMKKILAIDVNTRKEHYGERDVALKLKNEFEHIIDLIENAPYRTGFEDTNKNISDSTTELKQTIKEHSIKSIFFSSKKRISIGLTIFIILAVGWGAFSFLGEKMAEEMTFGLNNEDFINANNSFNVQPSWGDNAGIDKGRQTYTVKEVEDGLLNEKAPTFNSILDGNMDQRKFVEIRNVSSEETDIERIWTNEAVEVNDGDVYEIRMLVHNNKLNGVKDVAENTEVKFNIPSDISNIQSILGYIRSSNAIPSEYWASVQLYNEENVFSLKYVENSFALRNAETEADGRKLPDFNNDHYTKIGYKYLDGEFPGGNQYATYVIMRVKVVFEASCEVKTTHRVVDNPDTSWLKTTEANVGDIIECQMYYRNTSDYPQHNVMLRYVLPDNLEYVPNSTIIYNTSHIKGALMKDDEITLSGVNIGDYNSQGNAYVRFRAKVKDANLAEGTNILYNWGAVTVNNKVAKDKTELIINK